MQSNAATVDDVLKVLREDRRVAISGARNVNLANLSKSYAASMSCGLIAAFILSSSVGSLRCRAAMVAMIGLFAWMAISVSQWNWYGFPFSFIALDAIDQVIGWLLAGFQMARMIRPPNK